MRIKPFAFLLLTFFSTLSAGYTLKDGKWIESSEVSTMSASDHHTALLKFREEKAWPEVIKQARILIQNFPDSPFYQESLFYLAEGSYETADYEISNKNLTNYLKKQGVLQHFREAIEMKFQIAEQFRHGARKHLLGLQAMPKWVPAEEEAIKLYEEVILALPNDELAAKALYGKASLQVRDEDQTGSIESYQTLIRRFPKNNLAPEAYVEIGKIYLAECKEKYPDTDFLDLAEINLRKFRQDFPTDERLVKAEKMIEEMQEIYAESFFEIAQFFERTKKPHASMIYYSKIIKSYPKTKAATLSQKRLALLTPANEEKKEKA